MYSQEKLDLIDKMIEYFRSEDAYGSDTDTLVDCIKTVINFGKEDSAT